MMNKNHVKLEFIKGFSLGAFENIGRGIYLIDFLFFRAVIFYS